MRDMLDGKKDFAYDVIKKKIIEGELRPMESLSEIDLAQELNISRTPVHQALLRLKEDGFIYIYPRRGTIVANLTPATIQWMFETRALLEPHLTRVACGKLPTAWLEKIHKEFTEVAAELARGENAQTIQRSIELDGELHRTICEVCSNRFIRDTMNRLNDYNQWIRVRTSRANTTYIVSVEAHLRIIEALMRNDAEAAGEEMRDHIIQSEKEAYVYNE